MAKNLSDICLTVVRNCRKRLREVDSKIFENIKFKTKDQAVTEADVAVSETIIETLKELDFQGVLYDEEKGYVKLNDNPESTAVSDSIDGTSPFIWGRGKLLPYTTIISIFDKVGENIRYNDVVAAAMVEHTTGNVWHAVKGEGCFLNGERTRTSGRKELSDTSPVLLDFGPTPFNYENKTSRIKAFYNRLIGESWVINQGSAGYHFALVASGAADCHVLHGQKPDEMTAGYLMVNEAGGYVIDWDGNDIGNKRFAFKEKTPVIAGASFELCQDILRRR